MDDPSFFLEGIVKNKDAFSNFEGPLSLILMLLQKNKIEIRDIRIADILDQYLAYLEKMQSMDLEIASEFVQMASQLLYIKTKTLLAGDKESSELEILVQSLEQLKAKDTLAALQKLMPELKRSSERGLLYFSKMPEPLPKTEKIYVYHHKPEELTAALRRIYSRSTEQASEEIAAAMPHRIIYSVRDKSRELLSLLKSRSMSLHGLYALCRSRSEVIATFVSILELCGMGSLSITQSEGDYTVAFSGGDIEQIIGKIVE